MPETLWGPNVVPYALEEFDPPAVEGAWEMWDVPVPLGAFQVEATEWPAHDWFAPLGFLMAAEGGVVFLARSTKPLLQAVTRASFF